jgi:6-phosphofructokinase 1
MSKVFFSYCLKNDTLIVARVYWYLSRHAAFDVFLYPEVALDAGSFPEYLRKEIEACQIFVLFHGTEAGETQKSELNHICNLNFRRARAQTIVVELADKAVLAGDLLPADFFSTKTSEWRDGEEEDDRAIRHAKAICTAAGTPFDSIDRLPGNAVFEYEKDIVADYLANGGSFHEAKVRQGCVSKWPAARLVGSETRTVPNPIHEPNSRAFKKGSVLVDARRRDPDAYATAREMAFVEAGPRERLRLVPDDFNYSNGNVAILVSGGLAPGVNAVIDGIMSRHQHYQAASAGLARSGYGFTYLGYAEGFRGLVVTGREPRRSNVSHDLFTPDDIHSHAIEGGSVLTTAREESLREDYHSAAERGRNLESAVRTLRQHAVRILYVIGGQGSMRGTIAIANAYRHYYPHDSLSIVAIPKTMDNDILWVWQSFGFMSAVGQARNLIKQLHNEVTANPRLCVVQLFGSDSGFVVSHAALGSGVCDLALIPEQDFDMDGVYNYIYGVLDARADRGPHGIIVMAETALPKDAEEYIDRDYLELTGKEKVAVRAFLDNNRRALGHTPDQLRSGALKIISGELQHRIRNAHSVANHWSKNFRVFVNEPRHLVRSTTPSAMEVAYANRLGTLAVDAAMAGFSDVMVSQWLTEFVLVPLDLVVLGCKRVRLDGMFWQSVEASTGQAGKLAKPSKINDNVDRAETSVVRPER